MTRTETRIKHQLLVQLIAIASLLALSHTSLEDFNWLHWTHGNAITHIGAHLDFLQSPRLPPGHPSLPPLVVELIVVGWKSVVVVFVEVCPPVVLVEVSVVGPLDDGKFSPQTLNPLKVTELTSTSQSPPQPVIPSNQPMSPPLPPHSEEQKTTSSKFETYPLTYPGSLQMDKLSSRPSWLNQMFTRSEVWWCETINGRFVLIVHLSSGQSKFGFSLKAFVWHPPRSQELQLVSDL